MPRPVAFVLVILLAVLQTATAEDRVERQRALFQGAHETIRDGGSVDIGILRERLRDYPLLPYLEYAYLLKDRGNLDPDAAEAFIEAYDHLPMTRSFRGQWLHELGAREDWERFHVLHRGGGSATLRCYGLQARKALSGVDDDWLRDARDLWQVGHSQPSACDPVFAELYDRDALSRDQRWERVTRAMVAGNAGLAQAIRERVHPDDRDWLDAWLVLNRDPAAALDDPGFDVETRRGRQLVRYGLNLLARQDRDAADRFLAQYAEDGVLEHATTLGLQREIALRAAYSRADDALTRLDSLPDAAVNDQVREWAARIAVGQENWPRVLSAVWALPDDLRNTSQWRYWNAHALWHTGARERADDEFRALADSRNYYGFLAADAVGKPYAMNASQPSADAERQRELALQPGMLRARELLRVGMVGEARREWERELGDADTETRAQAAMLAHGWGWYDRAIHNANRAGLHDALDLRFPAAYSDVLEPAAEEAGVDPSLVLAIARKESAFSPDARSRVGALGLLQVMPETGRRVASDLDLPAPGARDLMDPAINAQLGTTYLAQMLERFDGNILLAAAAYNAGPTRAEDWAERHAGQPAAVWIENITFGETRDYVKSILAFRAVFDWQRHGEPRRLAAAMSVMPGEPVGTELAIGDDTGDDSG